MVAVLIDADRARGDALAAAEKAGVSIYELDRFDQHASLSGLFDEIWAGPGASLVHQNLLTAMRHAGNYVVGAFAADRLVGGAVGFLGGAEGDLHLHSHMTGVVAGHQSRGAGRALKLHQRAWCIERSIPSVSWTYDPLVRHNAYFNVMKLGARIVGYVENFYGEMSDGINENEQSDRFVLEWSVASEHVQDAIDGHVGDREISVLRSEGAAIVLDEGPDGEPLLGGLSGESILCKVPKDIVAIRKSDPERARSWRIAARSTLGSAVNAGYIVRAVTRDGWYVLEKDAP